jgi:NhaA family Na+:H+ antiporter
VVGLEIRREISAGELRTWRRAAVPIGAAAAGMAVPALLYAALAHGDAPGAGGWGIPMATDVAFALGALALLAAGRAPRLRVFLMTLAVADDIGSVVVLVVFYSRDVHAVAIVVGMAAVAAMVLARRAGSRGAALVVVLGVVAWWAFAHGGVEAAVVGVAVGLLLPVRGSAGPRVLELRLVPVLNLLILPLFALANAGVRLGHETFGSAAGRRVFGVVLVARLVGKPLGIVAAALLLRPRGPARDPNIATRDLFAIGGVTVVGFTVPLLIEQAALPPGPQQAGATAGLLAASVLGTAGAAILLPHRTRRRSPR